MKNQVRKKEESSLAEKRGFKLPLYMKSCRWIILLGLLIVSKLGVNSVEAISNPWPMFSHDPQRSGRTTCITIKQPILKWSYFANSYIFAAPVIDHSGRIYLVTEDGDLHIISSSGKKEKIVSIGIKIDSTPAISEDGNIYIGVSNGHLLCFNAKCESQWVYSTNSKIKSSPAINQEGIIFIGCENGILHAINKDGSLKWKYQASSSIQSSPAISHEGIIYICCNDGTIHAINPDGNIRVKKDVKISTFSSPAIDSEGNVYVGSSDRKISIITEDGDIHSIPLKANIYSSPAIAKDGSVYIGTEDGLYGITPKSIWYAKTGRIFNSTPAITSDGIIYVASFDGKIHAVEPEEGKILWSYDISLGPTSLAIDKDGTIYVSARDRNLYAIGHQITPTPQKPKISIPKISEIIKKRIEKEEEKKEEEKKEEEKKEIIMLAGSPTNLVATVVSSEEIMLNWQDNADNEEGFKIYCKLKDQQTYTLIKTLPANSTSFLDVNLKPATTYQYRVVAYNKMGFSQYSAETLVTIKSLLLPPKPPTDLKVDALSTKQVTLSWSDNSDNELGFKLERKESKKEYAVISVLQSNTTTDVTISPLTTYFYRVAAYNDDGLSDYSNEIQIKTLDSPPTAPTNLQVSPISKDTIKITWQDNSNTEQGFKLERALPLQEYVQIKILPTNTTFYLDGGLKKDTVYYYRIKAYNKLGDSDYSNTSAARTSDILPAPPTNLTGVSNISTQIKLSWQDNSDNEIGFKIERRLKTELAYTQIAVLNRDTTSYQDFDLTPDTTYYYRVRAYNRAGNSEYSNLSITTLPVIAFVPTNLKANAISSSQINLSWTDNSDNESGFRLERKTEGKNYEEIYILETNNTTYQDKFLEPCTTYYYRIRAYNKTGNSSYSNESMATTKDTFPYPPSDLLAKLVSTTQIDLYWNDNSKNEQGFKIERSTDKKDYTQITMLLANTITYQDKNLLPNTTYYYRIKAYNVHGDSYYSDEVECKTASVVPPPITNPVLPDPLPIMLEKVVIPVPPSHLQAQAISHNEIKLTWQDNSDNETGFKIERKSIDDEKFIQIDVTLANTTSYHDVKLIPDTIYYYCIRAYNQVGGSDYSEVTLAKTHLLPPIPPSHLQAQAISHDEIKLTWQDNSDNETGFKIERRSIDDEKFVQIDVALANTTSYHDVKLIPDTIYYYCIKAYNQVGGSDYSEVTLAKTHLLPPKPEPKVIQSIGVDSPKLSWTYATKGRIYRSNPAIDTRGRIYVGSEDSYLYCLSSTGKLIWNYPVKGAINTSPVIGGDGVIYVLSSDTNLYAILPDGTLKWKYPVKFEVEASPIIGHNDVIYVFTSNGKVFSIHPDGRLLWTSYLGGGIITHTPKIDAKGNIYIGAGGIDGGLFCLDSIGALKWEYTSGGEAVTSPTIDSAGNVYIGLNNTFYSFTPQGTIRFKIEHEKKGWMKFSPVISPDGVIYYNICWSSQEGTLIAIGQNGKVLWEYPIGWSIFEPIIDSAENIYINSNDYNLTCISADGRLKWNYTIDSKINTSPNIGKNGTIYLGANNGQIYAINNGYDPPIAPDNLVTKAISYSQIDISWEDNSKDELGFIIERGTQPKIYNQLAILSPNITSYQDENLLPLTTYYYRIKAFNQNGTTCSSYSYARTLKLPPSLPTGVSIIPLKGGGMLKLNWQKPKEEAFSFSYIQIYRSIEKGKLGNLIADGIEETTYIDTDLVNNLSYYYTFFAFDIYGNKSESSIQYVGIPKDNISPEIIAYAPTGEKVSPEVSITVSFSEEMNKESIIEAFSITPDTRGSFTWKANKLIFTPLSDLSGNTRYTVSISRKARDITNNYLQKPFIWQFTTFNPAPIIWAYTPVDLSPSIFEGETLTFEVYASDPNHEDLRYSWKLDGVEKSTANSWIYTPSFIDAGIKTLMLNITDGMSTTFQNWILTVIDKNLPPTLSNIKDTTINIDELLQFNVSVSNPDNDPLTYNILNLPKGANFSDKTKIFSWRPTKEQGGTYQITFKVSDGKGGEDTKQVKIHVNIPPTIK